MPFPDKDSAWKEEHPDEGLLHEWLEEQLDTDAAARVASHVSTCETCRASVAEAHGLIAASRRILSALDDVPSGVVPAASASIARVASERDVDGRERDTAPSAHVAPVGANVTDISSAGSTRRARPDAFRWRRWGSIAAVLVIGVSGAYVLSERNGNVSVLNAVSDKTLSDSTRAADTRAATRAANPAAASGAETATQSIAKSAGTASAPAAAAAASAPVPLRTPAQPAARDREPAATSNAISAQQNLAKKSDALQDRSAVRGAVQAAPPPVATNSVTDSLSDRLESERRKRAAAEAVSADALARPRIDAVGGASKAYTQRATAVSAPAGVPATPSANRPAFTSAASFDSLVLVREPCFGRCPAYELTVNASGHAHYKSRHPDDNGRESSSLLSSDELTHLSDVINAARVDTLKSYMPDTPSCGMAATDMPTLHLSVYRGSRLFKLDQYAGCSAATKAVPALMRDIDAIVGTQRWLPAGYRLN